MSVAIGSVSAVCLDPLRFGAALSALEAAGCTELHFDVSDGVFAPDFGLNAETVAAARRCCGLACEVHLMTVAPDRHIARFIEAGCSSVIVHVEACAHAHRTLTRIRDAGVQSGVALFPTTPLTRLEYLLPFADRILLLSAEPGARGVVPSAFERVKLLRANLNFRKLKTRILVEGNIDPPSAALSLRQGADIVVLDRTSGIGTGSAGEVFRNFTQEAFKQRKTV